MINLESYIDSRRIQFLYRVINEPMGSCNCIGKYWLSRLDLKFNEVFFCSCSNISKPVYTVLSEINPSMDKMFTMC